MACGDDVPFFLNGTDAERLASLQAERDRLAEQVVALSEQSGETCQDCGQTYNVEWWAPHDLWGRVVGDRWHPANGVYFLCVRCFTRRADALGVSLCWSPWPVDPDTHTEGPVSYVECIATLEARLALCDAVVEAARTLDALLGADPAFQRLAEIT